MKTLHIVNKTGQPMTLCLRALATGDAILLIEDGVYNLLHHQPDCELFVLEADARARAVAVLAAAKAINYDEFVALTIQNDRIVSWF